MKTKIEESENREKILHIEVDNESLNKHLSSANRKVASRVNIPGFRKGKAPVSVVEYFVGRDYLVNEALESLIPDVVNSTIKENEIDAFTTPRVTVTDRNPVKLDATVALKPSIVISDYSDLIFDDPVEKITKKKINESLNQILESQAIWQPVNRSIIDGDLVIIDCVGRVQDKEFTNIKSTEMIVSKDNQNPFPDFFNKIIGLKENQEKKFSILLPENFDNQELQNKEADFVVKINGIKQKEIPELNDEFAKSLGEKEIQNVESLSKRIRINLEEKSKDELKKTLEEKTIDALIEKSKFVISPIIIENETEYIVDNQRKSLEAYKLDFDQYLERLGQTKEDFLSKAKETAENRIKRSILVDKLSELEEVEISDETIEKELEIILKNDPKISQKDNLDGHRENIKLMLSRQEALNVIIERLHHPKKKNNTKTKSKKEEKKIE